MKRRDFLKGCMACGAAATLGVSGKAWGIGPFEGYPEGMGVLVDLTRCVGCRSCEAACNKEQKLPAPDASVRRQIGLSRKNGGPRRRRIRSSTAMMPNPAGARSTGRSSATTAMSRRAFPRASSTPIPRPRKGAVIYNPKVCVGCRNCLIACPFLCAGVQLFQRVEPGGQEVHLLLRHPPEIRQARPHAWRSARRRCSTFGFRNDLLKIGRDRIREKPDRYVDHIFGEKEVGGTSWLYLAGVNFDQVGFDTTMSNDPILSNVKDFLGIVPMVLTIWPALFTGFHLLATKNKDHTNHGDGHSGQEDPKP
jgi:formate dehydrogenase iron-sulfur subunit